MPEPVPLDVWRSCGIAVPGIAHWRQALPCQDAVFWCSTPRPVLALSDGAGSSAASHLGSQALVSALARLASSLDDALHDWLDEPPAAGSAHARIWAERLRRHATGVLEDLARTERRAVRDLRATALLAIFGSRQIMCWHIGDGAIVARRRGQLEVISTGVKGEFSNQTVFADAAKIEDVRVTILPAEEVTALALLSDGGAERLVSTRGDRVAARLGAWFDELAVGTLSADRLAVAFHEPAMWERTTLDDRSIVAAARMSTSASTSPTLEAAR